MPLRASTGWSEALSVQRENTIVARLSRGEPLDLVARQTNVSIARLTEWRDRALAGAATALKERERDNRDDEIARLKSKVGEITMDNELLNAKIAALEGKCPRPTGGRDLTRRSRPPVLAVMAWRALRGLSVSRASVYRSLKETPLRSADRALCAAPAAPGGGATVTARLAGGMAERRA